jgi:adenylate cyclase class 1
MAMMERYLSKNYNGPMLCEVIKKRVLGGPAPLRDTDPYLLMLESIIELYEQTKRPDRMELLRKAFYIKADPQVTRIKLINQNCNYQTEVFKELMGSWNWSLDLCENLNQIENWSYARHLKFSNKINTFFFTTYKYLREVLADSEAQSINARDLTLLGRKLFVQFAKKENKLQLTPFLKKGGLTLEKCIFKFARNHSGIKKWFLFDATRYLLEKPDNRSIILSSRRVARSATWLVMNGLYDFHKTKVEMPPNPSELNVNDLIDLLKHIQGFFPPALQRTKLGTNMEEEAMINQIMIVIDLEKNETATNSVSTDLIYNNTWGEMFTETYPLGKALSVVREALNQDVCDDIYSKVQIHITKSSQIKYSKSDIYHEIIPN